MTAPALTPAELGQLAAYNAEQARGIIHTREWQARMAQLQRRYETRRSITETTS